MPLGDDEQPSRGLTADQRDHIADQRDGLADRREVVAERREQVADVREQRLDDLDDDLRGHPDQPAHTAASDRQHQGQILDRSEDRLERSYKGIDRTRAQMAREEAGEARAASAGRTANFAAADPADDD